MGGKMARAVYVFRDGKWIERGELPPPEPRVHVIQDSMPATLNPLTGRMTDSKSELRNEGRARGLVEVGNEKLEPRPERDDGSLKRTIIDVVNSKWK